MRQSRKPDGNGAVERFRPTSGRLIGIILLAAAAVTAVLSVVDSDSVIPEVGVGAVLVGILAWSVTLRPRVSLVGDELELRGMVDTVAIPLAAVEELAVRQVLAVRAGDKRYTSPAVGRTRRALVKGKTVTDPDTAKTSRVAAPSYAEFVEDRVRQRVDDAIATTGIRRGSPEQVALGAGVRRSPAWPEIVALVTSAVGLVVVIVL